MVSRHPILAVTTAICLWACTVLAQPAATDTTQPGAAATPATGNPQAEVSQAARAVAKEGIEFMKEKRFKEAINKFMAAAKQHPKNGQLRNLLGTAYAEDKQLGQAWLQFRSAVVLDPQHAAGIRNFLMLWTAFDRKGVVNIGRSKTELAKLLGEPDGKSGTEEREVWQYGFMRCQFLNDRLFAVIDPRGLDAAALRPADVLKVDFDDETRWRLGYRIINRVESRTQYVPAGQAVQNWEELYTVQRFFKLIGRVTPSQMMAQIQEKMKEVNPDIKFQVLGESTGDVVFYSRSVGTKEKPVEHEIVRLVAGKEDIHRLAYSRRGKELKQEEAKQWLALLKQAKLTAPTPPPQPAK